MFIPWNWVTKNFIIEKQYLGQNSEWFDTGHTAKWSPDEIQLLKPYKVNTILLTVFSYIPSPTLILQLKVCISWSCSPVSCPTPKSLSLLVTANLQRTVWWFSITIYSMALALINNIDLNQYILDYKMIMFLILSLFLHLLAGTW